MAADLTVLCLAECDRRDSLYADPTFVPGMVVCAANRDPDDCRIWEYAATGEGDFAFYELWRTDFDNCTYDRVGLPERLAVVGDDGKVKP